MGGTSAAMMLHRMIHAEFGWRGEFQVCESLQMAAADRALSATEHAARRTLNGGSRIACMPSTIV